MELTGLSALLLFAGVPLALAAVVYAAVYGSDAARRARSAYRPGRAWPHDPVWLRSSETGEDSVGMGGAASPLSDGSGSSALDRAAVEAPVPGPALIRARARRVARAAEQGTVAVVREFPGGARGSW